MSEGVWVLLIAVVGAVGFGIYRALTDGRIRGTRGVRGLGNPPGLDTTGSAGHVTDEIVRPWSDQLGERGTLVQFSSAFCAPCRTTRQVLANVAETVPGIAHIEIDAEHHLELVRELGIMRTPTTLILDAHGVERFRAAGVPKRDQVIEAL